MVGIKAPDLLFSSLNNLFRSASVSKDEIKTILTDQKQSLFRAITISKQRDSATKDPQVNNDVSYRSGLHTSTTHPKPTQAELVQIQSLEKGLGITRGDAAILLRDFLEDSHQGQVSQLLTHCTNLSDVAPVGLLEQFWWKEVRSAFSCFVVICAGGSPSSTHLYYPVFSSFLAENASALKTIIIEGVKFGLRSSQNQIKGNSLRISLGDEQSWIMELLFAYCQYEPLQPGERVKLIQAFVAAVKNGSTFTQTGSVDDVLMLTGLEAIETTALFAASVNLSNGLASLDQPRSEDTEEDVEHEQSTMASELAQNQPAIILIDDIVSATRSLQTAETAFIALSWASFLRLRSWFDRFSPTGTTPNIQSLDPMGHMQAAIENNVLAALRNMSMQRLQVDELLISDLFQCFWADFVAFLTAFPPQNCSASQIEDVVDLAASLLSRTRPDNIVLTAENFWEREKSHVDLLGSNTLLTLSSSVFPRTFRPLISLLTSLTVSQSSAERAADYLSNRLVTLTEYSDTYQTSLLVLDQEDDAQIWQSMNEDSGSRLEKIFCNVAAACPEDVDLVYVQAGEDILGDIYRRKIVRGSLGASNRSLSEVTWIIAWDGFGAADHILRVLLRILQEHEGTSMYGEDVLNELLLSAIDGLKFIDRLCRTGSRALRESAAKDESRLLTVAGIVAELADPGDWIRGSWLTKKRRELLLTVSSSCVASMAIGSAGRARYVLERICSSKTSLPLETALSSLGPHSFPAVAALSRIASLCAQGESLSKNLLKKLSLLSRSNEIVISSESLEGYRGGASMVYNFLRGFALPLWLTTSTSADVDLESKALHWLLPACSLHLFSKRPSDVLNDPAISAVLITVLMGAASYVSTPNSQSDGTDTFLFPALRSALLACYEALLERNASLQQRGSDTTGPRENGEGKMDVDSSRDLTALEKQLLKPDVIHAMAVMSSGSSEGLRRRRFFSTWAQSEFRGFLPDLEQGSYLFLNATQKDTMLESITSWKTWVEDMCARCLSLQFCCLSQVSEAADIIQAPWPTMDSVALGYWRSGGESIRRGYAHRIRKEYSIATVELMVTVISSGQRAAARSLMGPRPKISRTEDASVTGSGPETQESKQDGQSSGSGTHIDQGSGEQAASKNEILAAIVDILCKSRDTWVTLLSELGSIETSKTLSILKNLGQSALLIAACVRFLRICREMYNSKWFEECWEELHIWELLASLLRCDGAGSRAAGKVDLSRAVGSVYQALSESFITGFAEMLHSSSTETVVLKQSLLVDVVSAWKTTASDCFSIFAEVISTRTSESLVFNSSRPDLVLDKTDRKENILPAELFKEESFAQFAAVFTERWMHILLGVDEQYLGSWSRTLINESYPGGRIRQFSTLATEWNGDLSAEQHARQLSVMLGNAIGLSDEQAEKAGILEEFRRIGDIRTRFGSDYYFDVPAIVSFLRCLDVNIPQHKVLVLDILHLNAVLNRKEVQVGVISSFSTLASKVVFTDAFVPHPTSALTYSSPQFRGKLCRFLSRLLVFVIPSLRTSVHSFAICSEISKLMGFLSAYLSVDELEQAALTSIRFPDPPDALQRQCALSPLGQICYSIDHILALVQEALSQGSLTNFAQLDVVRWLLLTGARLASGVSFRGRRDLSALGVSSIATLKCAPPAPALCSAAAVAITSVLHNTENLPQSRFNEEAIDVIFAAVAALASSSAEKQKDGAVKESAANLILSVARIQLSAVAQDGSRSSHILRHLSGGTILGLLPSSGVVIPTYESSLNSRNPAHLVWVASLQLAGITIPERPRRGQSAQEREQERRIVLEFCATNLTRITRDSLNLSGDWPSSLSTQSQAGGARNEALRTPQHLTIGRIEEAEVACFTLFKLSNYLPNVRDAFPELLDAVISKLLQFSYCVHRLTRAAPVERWVRPVTIQERERSQLLRSDRDGGSASFIGFSPSPWNMSPSKAGGVVSNSPPRRSPSQALRAAIGGSGVRGGQSPALFSPSPGVPGTPQFPSPYGGGSNAQNSQYLSPISPWGPHGFGLITNSGVHFGEEVSRSLLRALGMALATLRSFSEKLEVMLFSSSMMLSEDNVSLGTLVAFQYHACSDICRGADGERRDALQMIIDNAIHLTITHTMAYDERGVLTQGIKDELRKRVGTVRAKLLKVVPPVPSQSLIHAPEFEAFLYYLKGTS